MRRVIVVVAICLGATTVAHADKIDVQVRQLRNADSYKLRLSAALSLAKTRDRRAVAAMVHALRRDDTGNIRRVAALSLGKMVDASVPAALRKRALAALKQASKRDKDPKVRKSAARALRTLAALRSSKRPAVFVAVGKPADVTRKASSVVSSLERQVRQTLGRSAPSFAQTWGSRKLPTEADLRAAGTKGFYVGATVSKVEVRKNGRRAEIRCSVSIRVNPWNGTDGEERWQADRAASSSGNGKVLGSSSKKGIRSAMEDCVLAVSEELTARQVVPFIERLAKQ